MIAAKAPSTARDRAAPRGHSPYACRPVERENLNFRRANQLNAAPHADFCRLKRPRAVIHGISSAVPSQKLDRQFKVEIVAMALEYAVEALPPKI